MARAGTAGTHPKFVRMLRELIVERIEGRADRPALGELGPSHDVCPVDCCLSGRPRQPPRRGRNAMNRIFLTFSIVVFIAVGAALLLGLRLGDFNADMNELRRLTLQARVDDVSSEQTARLEGLRDDAAKGTTHRLTGLIAALAVVLVNSIAATYFIGTGRWGKEVVESYRLDSELDARALKIKRRAFPWAISNMLWGVGIVALGGASDPSGAAENSAAWVNYHLWFALGGAAWLLFSSSKIYGYILQQQSLVAEVLQLVRQRRIERGLEPDDAPATA